jgi:hypothetical protein
MKRIMTLVLFVAGGSLVFAQNEGKKGSQAGPSPGTVTPSRGSDIPLGTGIGSTPGEKPASADDERRRKEKRELEGLEELDRMADKVLGNHRIEVIEDHGAAVLMRGARESSLHNFMVDYVHPDFQLTSYDGFTYTKKEDEEALTQNTLSFTHVSKHEMHVTRSLDLKVATVRGTANIRGFRRTGSNTFKPFSNWVAFTDTFVDVSNDPGNCGEGRRWQCISSSQTLTNPAASKPNTFD